MTAPRATWKKGLRKGIDDHRCDSLMMLMEKLKEMKNRPSFILLENVVGFEESSAHDAVIDTLHDLNYGTKECILSPLQFGVPNSRPRYYLIASTRFPVRDTAEEISGCFPQESSAEREHISSFVDASLHTPSLFLDKDVIQRYGRALDVIIPSSTRSACFTKSYGSYISGCGSYFCDRYNTVPVLLHLIVDRIFDKPIYRPDFVCDSRLTNTALDNPDNLVEALRRLSPREVANLMCFPKDFEVPPDVSDRQMYQCLGNSINVRVVSSILRREYKPFCWAPLLLRRLWRCSIARII
ncbi:C-5 cytosine-specific DNA methylase [Ancylostoma ceylanicum]|uniref:C-5 cytosine-specific DNA methylase n=1 Tax=Ancylostoma ceylanicum TaxID=53326 RepID=A0A0D6M2R5_9BILA|nr:C-5 cytosine-specific DNA methylase [Ancylostoma ceylanicum]